MLIKHAAYHLRQRIQEHVVSERRRPIGDGQPGFGASDNAADDNQHEGCAYREACEPMQPRAIGIFCCLRACFHGDAL